MIRRRGSLWRLVVPGRLSHYFLFYYPVSVLVVSILLWISGRDYFTGALPIAAIGMLGLIGIMHLMFSYDDAKLFETLSDHQSVEVAPDGPDSDRGDVNGVHQRWRSVRRRGLAVLFVPIVLLAAAFVGLRFVIAGLTSGGTASALFLAEGALALLVIVVLNRQVWKPYMSELREVAAERDRLWRSHPRRS